MQGKKDKEKGLSGVYITIAIYIILSFSKVFFGSKGNSEALRADGFNNAMDILAAIAVIVGIKIAYKPADENHSYGHYKAENIASLLISIIMFYVSFEILISSIGNFVNKDYKEPDIGLIVIAVVSAITMWIMFKVNMKNGKRYESDSLKTLAQDNKADALVSIGTVVGIVLTTRGLLMMDLVVAGLISLIISKSAIVVFRKAVFELMDGIDVDRKKEVESVIKGVAVVKEVVEIKVRKHGEWILTEITLKVDASMTVKDSHDVTEKIEKQLCEIDSKYRTVVHIEPYMKEKPKIS